MAIYHLHAKLISRKVGRSATGAAAYRAGEKIIDERTGAVHDYTRKQGVEHREIVLPSGVSWQPDRSELWNAVEAKNKRADAQVAREFVVALPEELSAEQRTDLAVQFARDIADRYRVAADVAIHQPSGKGDERNHHAHILTSTNTLNPDGTFGNKARALDLVAHNMSGGIGSANAIDQLRERWAELANQALERAGLESRIDHRTLEAQGIAREPTQHKGPAVSGMEQRGKSSEVGRRLAEEANARLYAARETGRIEREMAEVDRSILDLSGDRAGAIQAREERRRQAERPKGAERTGPAVNASRFKVRSAEESIQRGNAERKVQARREAEAECARLRTDFESMPIEQQAKALDLMLDRLAQEREARLESVIQKAAARRDRRRLAARELWEAKPKPPQGLLARFQRPGYETALGQWQKDRERAVMLREQAETTHDKIAYERFNEGFYQTWARRVLERTEPALTRCVEAHRAEKQEHERQALERAKLEHEFKGMAARRAVKAHGYTDGSQQWRATPEALRKMIDDYNRQPQEARERTLAIWMRHPEKSKTIATMIERCRERTLGHGMSR